MSQDLDRRTVEPTPKRIRDFRERGEVARSKDLTGAATTVFGAMGLLFFMPTVAQAVSSLWLATHGTLSAENLAEATSAGLASFLWISIPVSLAAIAAFAVAAAPQLGVPPAVAWPKFDLTRPFAFKGISELVNPKAAAWRAIKSILKVLLVGVGAAVALSIAGSQFEASPALRADQLLHRLSSSTRQVFTYAGGALLLIAVADYFVARRRMAAKMRMTPEEIKRELKDQQGDPEIRKARRRRMRELSQRRLVQEVKTADAVVVNPTHYAVAIRYVEGKDGAPRVVAKGMNVLAAKIREIARKNSIPVLSRPPLARLLYKTVPEGREVPAKAYRAVAEVLAFVYRIKRGLK